jgi:hypothetical protein
MEHFKLYLLPIEAVKSLLHNNGWLYQLLLQPNSVIHQYEIKADMVAITQTKGIYQVRFIYPLPKGLLNLLNKYPDMIWAVEHCGFLRVAGITEESTWQYQLTANSIENIVFEAETGGLLLAERALFLAYLPKVPYLHPDYQVFSNAFANELYVTGQELAGVVAVSWKGIPLLTGYQDNYEMLIRLPDDLPRKKGAIVLHTTTEEIITDFILEIR